MPTEAKRETVAELREALSSSRTLIVSEYRGLTVKEIAEIRRALRKQDVTYRVVKNRLMRIAAADSIGEALSPLLTGPTAIKPGIYDPSFADETLEVKTESAHEMILRLAREEGLFVGISSGAAAVAALRVAEELEEGVVVTLFPDAGYKYLSDKSLWEAK